jgi:alkanesulfonate monooxygenase SsuD/methylene tetrahydromethanopterin reductase-like flavin-dependent oxidoreductase (luciferase family)
MYIVQPVLGETDTEAQEKFELTYGLSQLRIENTLAIISAVTEVDFMQFDLDSELPDGITTNGHQSILDDFVARNRGKTLREALPERSQLGPQLVGTPDSVAAQMEEMMQEVGGDGFLIRGESLRSHSRRYIDEIASGLAPALRKRGLIRTEYRHPLFRDKLKDF